MSPTREMRGWDQREGSEGTLARNLTRTVQLEDGTELTLTANMNTFADFEDETGKTFFEADNSMVGVRARLWAFLHQAHPELSVRDVGGLITPGTSDFERIMRAVEDLARAMNPDPPARGTPAKAKRP